MDDQNAVTLRETYDLFCKINAFARLLAIDQLDANTLGQGAQEFLMRETGSESMDGLGQELQKKIDETSKIIDEALGGWK